VSCFGGSNGTIQVVISGGSGSPYSVKLNSGSFINVTGNTFTFTNLTANTYTITIRDSAGTENVYSSIQVTQPVEQFVTIVGFQTTTSNTGSITINSTGGVFPKTYTVYEDTSFPYSTCGEGTPIQIVTGVTQGNSEVTFTSLTAGCFCIRVTDNNGCITDSGLQCIFEETQDCVYDASFTELVPSEIDENTEINIWFDNSGSMNSTLTPLQNMRDTILKTCLIPFFNNNETLYNERVNVRNFTPPSDRVERTFSVLNTTGSTQNITKVINLVFQDEAQNNYHSNISTFDVNATRTTTYNTDISSFRNTLNSLPQGYYSGVVFRVVGFEGFRQFLVAVRDGLGQYSGTNGLSDKSEVTFFENVNAADTPTYYANQIIIALNTLGYNLQLCG
jgi:hypothetical protein